MMTTKDKSNSFMFKYAVLVWAAIFAVLLGGFMFHKIENRHKDFAKTVRQAHKVSSGYDVRFIEMVNNLEDILAERASFGYVGHKDPMTGTVRQVAVRRPLAPRAPITRRTAPVSAAVASVAEEPQEVMIEPDPVRLTAIIFDNARNTFTAVVMDGSRSLSVDVGDRVMDRRVTRITQNEIFMENDRERFVYNIMGGNTRIPI